MTSTYLLRRIALAPKLIILMLETVARPQQHKIFAETIYICCYYRHHTHVNFLQILCSSLGNLFCFEAALQFYSISFSSPHYGVYKSSSEPRLTYDDDEESFAFREQTTPAISSW